MSGWMPAKLSTLDDSNRFILTGVDQLVAGGASEAGAGDINVNGGADSRAATLVKDVAADIGNRITLLSGARLTLDTDGRFEYPSDPSDAETRDDGFTYTVADARGGFETANVEVRVDAVVNQIEVTPLEDVLRGTAGDDGVSTLAGDDVIPGSTGSDLIDGDNGTDTVVHRGLGEDYHQDLLPNGDIMVEKPGGGVDTPQRVERIAFNNGDLVYDIDSSNTVFGYRICQASFARTPDEGGLRFWIGVLDRQGWSECEKQQFLATRFIGSDGFRDLFGANPTNEQYIGTMYLNVLFCLPDQGGYDFWVGGMEQGLTREDILIAFTVSGENVDNTGANLDDGVWVVNSNDNAPVITSPAL